MKLHGESGFTIVEVAIAIIIFMVAIIGVTVVFTSGTQNITGSKLREEAKAYAGQVLESIKKLPFYMPYNGTERQDIDDFYYIATDAGGTQKGNPDQLGIDFNAAYQGDEDYGTITGHPNLRQKVRVQYQAVNMTPGPYYEQLTDPPAMKDGWGPMTVGSDDPTDSASNKLRLELVRVTVYFRDHGVQSSVTLDDMAGDSQVKYYPRVDSVTPNGVEQGTSVTLKIVGEGFTTTSPGPTVMLTKVGHTDITCTVSDYSMSTQVIVSTGILPSNMVGAGEDAYWNVKVRNSSGMASTLKNGIYVVQNPPTIFYLTPVTGATSSWVKITGQDFGVKRDANDNVKFNGTSVLTYGDGSSGHSVWSNNVIWAQVPAGATTGYVTVSKGAMVSNGSMFTVTGGTGPAIVSINNVEPGESGAHGDAGNRVRIYGVNFGTRATGENVVFTSSLNATVNFWTDTVIECVVPSGGATGAVKVHKLSGDSNNVTFTYDPVITAVNNIEPSKSGAHGAIGDRVRINGTYFGSRVSGENVVFSNGVNATINSWSDTAIECVIPSGAVSGQVFVRKSSDDSNAVSFTID